MSSKDEGKNSKYRSREKDNGGLGSALERHGSGGKDAQSRDCTSSGSRRKLHPGHEKGGRVEDGDQEVTRIPQEPKTHSRPPFRDVKCKGSLEGSTSSSKTCRFHCCTCEIIIYSVDPLVNP